MDTSTVDRKHKKQKNESSGRGFSDNEKDKVVEHAFIYLIRILIIAFYIKKNFCRKIGRMSVWVLCVFYWKYFRFSTCFEGLQFYTMLHYRPNNHSFTFELISTQGFVLLSSQEVFSLSTVATGFGISLGIHTFMYKLKIFLITRLVLRYNNDEHIYASLPTLLKNAIQINVSKSYWIVCPALALYPWPFPSTLLTSSLTHFTHRNQTMSRPILSFYHLRWLYDLFILIEKVYFADRMDCKRTVKRGWRQTRSVVLGYKTVTIRQ